MAGRRTPSELVGRVESRDFLLKALGYGAQVAVVLGGPGAGKTALLAAVAAGQREQGVRVVEVTGQPLEADLAFAALVELLSSLDRTSGPRRRAGPALVRPAAPAAGGAAPGRGAGRRSGAHRRRRRPVDRRQLAVRAGLRGQPDLRQLDRDGRRRPRRGGPARVSPPTRSCHSPASTASSPGWCCGVPVSTWTTR